MKGRRIFGVLWGLWCAGAALFAAAQEPPADEAQQAADRSGTIETVTVVGARPMADIGIQKTVFDEELLREDVTFSLADMLAHNSPVYIKSHGRGTAATVSLRGTGASHTQVMWNGMSMNSPLFGMMDLSPEIGHA